MQLSKYPNTDERHMFYIATCLAKETEVYSRPDPNKSGENLPSYNFITVYVGFERGMTDSGQPCWSRHSSTEFASSEEVRQLAERYLPVGYDFELIPRTLRIYRVSAWTLTNYKFESLVLFERKS